MYNTLKEGISLTRKAVVITPKTVCYVSGMAIPEVFLSFSGCWITQSDKIQDEHGVCH